MSHSYSPAAFYEGIYIDNGLELPRQADELLKAFSLLLGGSHVVITAFTKDFKEVQFSELNTSMGFGGVFGTWPDGAPLQQSPDFYSIQDGFVVYEG